MEVSTLEWTITLGVTIAVLLFDVIVIARDPREPTMKECAIALCFYIGAALAFGAWVLLYHGHDYGIEFYAGWLTEYSLSMDNLFVFIVLMAALKVPRQLQQEALMVGIILALVFRGIFIALGYQLINNFSWVFYVFGAFLVYTAVQPGEELPLARGRAPRGQRGGEVRPVAPQRRRRVPRPEALVPAERRPRRLADADRDHRARYDRRAVRARLDPGDLRHHPGALPGVHRQRVRADGPAAALLPARRAAEAAGLPVARACRSSSRSSA